MEITPYIANMLRTLFAERRTYVGTGSGPYLYAKELEFHGVVRVTDKKGKLSLVEVV